MPPKRSPALNLGGKRAAGGKGIGALAAAGRRRGAAAAAAAVGGGRKGKDGGPSSSRSASSTSSAPSSQVSSMFGNRSGRGDAPDPFLAFTGGVVTEDSTTIVAPQDNDQPQVDHANHPFQHPNGPSGISPSAVMYAMFDDLTRLFRVTDGTRLLFYNDTTDVDFVVKIRFDRAEKFNPSGSARWFAEMIPGASMSVADFLDKKKESLAALEDELAASKRQGENSDDALSDSLRSGSAPSAGAGLGSCSSAVLMSPVGSMVFRSPSMLREKLAGSQEEEAAAEDPEENYVVSRYVMDIIPPGETSIFGSGRAIGQGFVISFGQRPHARLDRTQEPLSCEYIFDLENFSHAQHQHHTVSKTAKVYPVFPDGLHLFRVHDHERLLFYNDTEDTQYVVKVDVDAAVAQAGGAAAGLDAKTSVKLLGSATSEEVALTNSNSSNKNNVSTFLITDIVVPGAVQPLLSVPDSMPLSHFTLSVHEMKSASDLVKPDHVFQLSPPPSSGGSGDGGGSSGWDRALAVTKFVSVFQVVPGKLYRIHDGDRLLFYNDTVDENIDVTVELPGAAHVSPFGSAIRKKARRGLASAANQATTTITDTVYAGKTQPFCKGETNRHTITVVSRPVPKPESEASSTNTSARPQSGSSASGMGKTGSSKYTAEQIAAGAGRTRKASALLVDPVTFDFVGPGPMHLTDSARVFSMFEDCSRLFRIVNMNMLFFYNDTASHDFIVRVTFPRGVRVTPAQTAQVDVVETNKLSGGSGGGGTVIVDVVPPMATKCVAENIVNGYRVSFAQRVHQAGQGQQQKQQQGGGHGGGGAAKGDRTSSVGSKRFIQDSTGEKGLAQRALANPRYTLNGPHGIKTEHLIFECFDEGDGMLLRVVSHPKLNRWWFYNDTIDAEMHVSVKFFCAKNLKALGSAAVVHSSDSKEDVDLVTDVVLPGETAQFMMADEIHHFSCNFSAKSVSAANRKRMKEAAAPLITEDRERFREMMHTAQQEMGTSSRTLSQEEAIELCLDEYCSFIDNNFPPHDLSIFRPTRDVDDPGFVAWMRPAVAAAADTIRAKKVGSAGAAGDSSSAGAATAASSSAAAAGVFKGQKSIVFGPAVEDDEILSACDDDDDTTFDDGRGGKRSPPADNNSNRSNNKAAAPDSMNFMDAISPQFVRDGSILHTWLSCAIAALAAYPEYIRDVFRAVAPKDQGRRRMEQSLGVHRVSILRNEWFAVDLVDDFLPCVGRSLCCIRHSQAPTTELWPALLEKVFAKSAGSYAAILGGDPLLAISTVTGFPCSRLDREFREATGGVDGVSTGTASSFLFATLRDAARAGNICIVSTKSSYTLSDAQFAVEEHKLRESGLELDRTYHIVDIKHFPEHEDLRLVKVRNNWLDEQHPGWRGAWSINDPQWKNLPDVAEACGWVPPGTPRQQNSARGRRGGKDDDDDDQQQQQQQLQQTKNPETQEFWIEWRDLLRYCNNGGVCYANKRWTNYRVRTNFDVTDGCAPLALKVTCKQATSAIFCIAQPGLSAAATEARYGRPYLSVCLALLAPFEDYLSSFISGDGDGKKDASTQEKKYAVRASSSRVISSPHFSSGTELKHYSGRYVGFKYDFHPTKEEHEALHTPFYVVPHCDMILEDEDKKSLQFCFCCFTEDETSLDVQFVKLENVKNWFGGQEEEEEEEDVDDPPEEEEAADEEEQEHPAKRDGDGDGDAAASEPKLGMPERRKSLTEVVSPPPKLNKKPVETSFPIVATPIDEDFQFKVVGQAPKQKHGWQFEI